MHCGPQAGVEVLLVFAPCACGGPTLTPQWVRESTLPDPLFHPGHPRQRPPGRGPGGGPPSGGAAAGSPRRAGCPAGGPPGGPRPRSAAAPPGSGPPGPARWRQGWASPGRPRRVGVSRGEGGEGGGLGQVCHLPDDGRSSPTRRNQMVASVAHAVFIKQDFPAISMCALPAERNLSAPGLLPEPAVLGKMMEQRNSILLCRIGRSCKANMGTCSYVRKHIA